MPSHPIPSAAQRGSSASEEEGESAPASRVARKERSEPGDAARAPGLPALGLDGRGAENAAADYPVGRTLAGRYRLERWMGEGSMGAVVAARHLGLDERVAIKFIRSELRRDPNAISRFAREAKALAQVKSDHVTRVLDVGVSLELGPFIVLEHLEGRDLHRLLLDEGPLPAARAVDYVLQACEALAAAHRVGIIHRDIKPENLFLARIDEVDTIKVLDFGISTGPLEGRVFGGPVSQRRVSDALMGTPLYMAPERVRNAPDVDRRADIWSLGAVLYELITARTLYVGQGPLEVCARVLEDAAVPLELGEHQASPELAAVIARCLCKDRAARFGDVGELGLALQPFARAREPFYGRRTQPLQLPRSPAFQTARPGRSRALANATPNGAATPHTAARALALPERAAPLPVRGGESARPRENFAPRWMWRALGAALVGCSVAYAWSARPPSHADAPAIAGPAELVPSAPARAERGAGARPLAAPPRTPSAITPSGVALAPSHLSPSPLHTARAGKGAASGPRAPAPAHSRQQGSALRRGMLAPRRAVAHARAPRPAGAPPQPARTDELERTRDEAAERVRLVETLDRVPLVDDHPAVLQSRASRVD